MEKFSTEELNYINDVNATDIPTANVNLLKVKEEEVKKLCGQLPEGKDTDRYISNMTAASVKTFKQVLNKKLHSLAKEIK